MKRIVVMVAAVSLAAMSTTTSGQASACSRDCLIGFAEQYIAALAAKDPSKLPLAPNVTRAPYGMGSGWSSRADALSDRIQFEK